MPQPAEGIPEAGVGSSRVAANSTTATGNLQHSRCVKAAAKKSVARSVWVTTVGQRSQPAAMPEASRKAKWL